jgi:tight adherence protein B
MNPTYALFGVLLFVAVALALEGAHQIWASKHSASAKRLAARLEAIKTDNTSVETTRIERTGPSTRWKWLDDQIAALLPRGRHLLHYVETSGTGKTAGGMLALSSFLGTIGFFLPVMLARPFVFSLLGASLLGISPWFWLARRRGQRMRLFEAQIPESLDLMGRAMRAGHAFSTAVKMVGEEMREPLGPEFRILFDEMNYGVPQANALLNLAHRVPIPDLSYFVVAVTIQRESGGNLAELLDKIASVVRARLLLLGEVRTLSAEGRLSAWILGSMPFVTGLLINLLTPKFMSVLWTDPAGIRLVGASLLSMLIGVVWMRSIIRIRV